MFTALTSTEAIVRAKKVTKEDGPFTCKGCHDQLILKQGPYTNPHFAHVSLSHCSYGAGETDAHSKAKLAIHDALALVPHVSDLQVERAIGNRVGDVSFRYNNQFYTDLEMQMSSILSKLIGVRTHDINTEDFFVLWLLPLPSGLQHGQLYRARIMELYLHALLFDRAYFYAGGQEILIVEFHEHQPTGYFDLERKAWIGGDGYIHKRLVTPLIVGRMNITDLQPVQREPQWIGSLFLQGAKLWCLPPDPERSRKAAQLYPHWFAPPRSRSTKWPFQSFIGELAGFEDSSCLRAPIDDNK